MIVPMYYISIHAPLAGCDEPLDSVPEVSEISIHAPLAGCDSTSKLQVSIEYYFNPRTPCGVRPVRRWVTYIDDKFQSTHPLRGATLSGVGHARKEGISIHAPLAGCDLGRDGYMLIARGISIHAPLAGCDTSWPPPWRCWRHFNPRTPCGVRRAFPRAPAGRRDFNPRTPCGVRRQTCWMRPKSERFQSTHPLRGATRNEANHIAQNRFQSTHPLRGATLQQQETQRLRDISIHAPLAGCDRSARW